MSWVANALADLLATFRRQAGGGQVVRGRVNGLVGIVIFAGSLPATRAAVGGFEPVFLTAARASTAGLLAWGLLRAFRQRRPAASDLPALAMVALGVVVGFPLLTALALQRISAAHSLVFVGLLPLFTASFGVLRAGERPRLPFWLFATLGSGFVIGYSVAQGIEASMRGDLLMLAAVLLCGLGYAEGARISRGLGGWQVISWSLVLALPFMLVCAVLTWPAAGIARVDASAWIGFTYVAVFSSLIGFAFWYRGLAQGGIAAVSQLQLLQPFIGFGMAWLFLHESVSGLMMVSALGALCSVLVARRYVT